MSSLLVGITPSDEIISNKPKSDKCCSTYVPRNRFSRYTTAFANLVPIRFTRTPGSEIPVDKVGLFSSICVSWLSEYITAEWKNALAKKPFPTISTQESSQVNGPRIEALWHAHIVRHGQAGASVPRVAWQFVQTRVIIGSLINLLGMLVAVCSPLLVLKKIIFALQERANDSVKYSGKSDNNALYSVNLSLNSSISSEEYRNANESIWKDLIAENLIIFSHIFILVGTEFISYFFIAWSAAINLRTATRLRSACLALAYRKLIRSSIRFKAPAYQTLTYFVPERQVLYELIANGPQIFSGPLILLLISLFIWYSIGHWALIGAVVLTILYLSLLLSAFLVNRSAMKSMNFTLRRFNLLEELVENIFLAKVGQWDARLISQMESIRKKELANMKRGAFSEGCSLCLIHIIPIVIVIAITMPFLLAKETIMLANYIPCLVLIFLNVKNCVRSSWFALSNISHGIVSLNKLKNVLTLKDAERYTAKPIDKDLAITINNGHFSWDSTDNCFNIQQSITHCNFNSDGVAYYIDNHQAKKIRAYELTDINFYASKGKLIGIVGPSGCGKTSLSLAIMGQLNRINGEITMDGILSYVPDDICLFEGTVKENIIMADAFNATLYYKTIQACGLSNDINDLPSADDTDISFIDLTIIQKQKISLARAVYTSRDIIMLDNPIKDLDVHDAFYIFKQCIHMLTGKTIILISDRVEILKPCDTIYVMSKGQIVNQGTYEWLFEHSPIELKHLREKNDILRATSMKCLFDEMNQRDNKSWTISHGHPNDGGSSSIRDLLVVSRDQINKESDELVDEQRIRGRFIPKIDYRPFNDKYDDSSSEKYLKTIAYILSILFSIPIATAPLLFLYITQNTLTNSAYIIAIIFSSVVAMTIILGAILMVIFNIDVFNATTLMYKRWLQKIYRAQISAFSAICSSTVILINISSLYLREVEYILPKLIITVLIHVGISLFSFIIMGFLSPWLLIPATLLIIGTIGLRIYVGNLLEALNNAQIESITPIYIYAVHTVEQRVVIQAGHMERHLSKIFYKYCNTSATYDFMYEAIKLWIEFRIKILAIVTLLGVLIIWVIVDDGLNESPGIAGLAFIFTLQLAQSLILLMQVFIDVKMSLRTIAFVDNYVQNIPQEIIKGDDNYRKDWPLVPSIHFQNVLLSYYTNYEPLNFSIYAGEKVAIVGGHEKMKRDFAKSLLQFDKVFSGNIFVGSMNIADIHIDTLRQYIDYIPTIPVLFNGSIRYNLEPNHQKPNKDVIAVLQKVGMWDRVSKLENKLDTDANSVFFSVIEKKLLMIARIYLNSRVNSRSIIIIETIGPDCNVITSLFKDLLIDFTIIVLSNHDSNWIAQRDIQL